MKKWYALCLAVLMLLSLLCGCAPADEKKLQGKWKASADLAAAYGDLLARSDASVAAHINLGEFKVPLTLRFESDGTYRLSADEEAIEKGAPKMYEAISMGMASYLQAQTGKTMENLFSATGQSREELMELYFSDDLAATIQQNLECSGTYKVSGGKLILYREDGGKFFEGKYAVDEDRLELKSGVTSDLITSLLPLKLKKK